MNLLASHPLARDLGWTLVHFLWQGMLIAALLALTLRLLRRTPAPIRYSAALLALALCVLAPVLTLTVLVKSRPAPITQRMFQPAEKAHWGEPETVVRVEAAPLLVVQPEQRGLIELWRMRVERWLPGFIALWLGGMVLLSARLTLGWLRLRRLANDVAPAPSEWVRAFEELCHRMGMGGGAVHLFSSARAETPAVLGWLKPVVLLPLARMNGLTPSQIEAILAHELAHVRRNDYFVNIVQSVVEVVLFYHPAAWWISAKIREERENCCDDVAVEICGNRVAYARALTVLEEARHSEAQFALAATGGSLLRRIQRLLLPDQLSIKAPAWTGAAALTITTLAAVVTISAMARDIQTPTEGADALAVASPAEVKSRFQIRRVALELSPATEPMTNILELLDGRGRREEVLHVEKEVFLDETAVAAASAQRDPLTGNWQVDLRFTNAGRQVFGDLTAGSIGRQLVLVVDGRILSAPIVGSAIPSGQAAISGAFSEEEVEAIARALSPPSERPQDDAAVNGLSAEEAQSEIPLQKDEGRDALSRTLNEVVESLQQTGELKPLYRTFRVEPDSFLRAITPETEAIPGSGLPLQEKVRDYFARTAGVAFPAFTAAFHGEVVGQFAAAPAKAMFFNDRTGVLFVRAEIEELARIEQAIHKAVPPPPPQVMIEARFVEIAGLESKPLDLDWLIGSTTPPGAPESGSASPAGRFPGNGTAPGLPRIETLLSPAGILAEAQFSVVLRALEQRQGVNMLSAPRVTTLSGRQAQLVVVPVKPVFGDVPQEILQAGFSFQEENAIQVGQLIDLIPTVREDGQQIELKVKAATNEFLGQESESRRPLFRLRQREATATMQDGQTLVLGGFEEWTNSSEKLPERRLLLFLTATLIDPAGNRLRAGRPAGFLISATKAEVLRQLRLMEADMKDSGDLVLAEWLPQGHTRRMQARLLFRENRLMSVEYEQQ